MKKLLAVLTGILVLGMTSLFAQEVLKPVLSAEPIGVKAPENVLATNNYTEDFKLLINVWHQDVYNSWDKNNNPTGGFKKQLVTKRYEVIIPAGAKDSVIDFSDLPMLEGNDYYWFAWTAPNGSMNGSNPNVKSITIDKKGNVTAK